jgi:hypothetical protein
MALYSRTDNEAQRRKVGATTALSSVNTDPAQDPADQPQDKVIPEQYIYIDKTEATIPANKARGLTAPGWWKYRTYTDAAGNTRHKAQHLVAFKSAPTDAADTDDRYAADFIVTITIDEQPTDQSTQAPAGVILTFTEGAGTTILAEADEEYEGVTGVADGDGVGATFTVVRDETGAIGLVTLTDAGTGYAEGEEITIDGADIGGVSGDDDLVITVDTVTTAAATFSVTASADPSGTLLYQWQTQTATGTRWTNITGATTDELELTGLTTSDSGKKYRVKITSSTGAPEVTSNFATLTVTAA